MAERRDIKRLIDEVDELFNNLSQMPRLVAHRRAFRPPVDVFRTDDPPTITVVAELAGVQPDDVELEVVEGGLIITGTRSHQARARRTYQCMEIIQGTFERRVPIAEPVDSGAATANFVDGLLTVVLPVASRPSGPVQVPISTARE